jgi:hypothetical protein
MIVRRRIECGYPAREREADYAEWEVRTNRGWGGVDVIAESGAAEDKVWEYEGVR